MRFVLLDARWALIEPHCLCKATDPVQTASDPRHFFKAVLWIVRTGASGGIYLASLANGTPCSSGSADGLR